MMLIETYVHVIGLSLTIILIGGYLIKKYLRTKNDRNT
jgi:hypothetical protein